jgi:MerR family transcriptional regulator, copper efflux regulator
VNQSSSGRTAASSSEPAGHLTIHEASAATGWSARMLRYIESLGLVRPDRSQAGYRLYGTVQLARLLSLRELVEQHGIGLGDAGFALRLSEDLGLRRAVDAWLAAESVPVRRLVVVPEPDWLGFEQDKQLRLLAVAGSSAAERAGNRIATNQMLPTPPVTARQSAGRKEIA